MGRIGQGVRWIGQGVWDKVKASARGWREQGAGVGSRQRIEEAGRGCREEEEG